METAKKSLKYLMSIFCVSYFFYKLKKELIEKALLKLFAVFYNKIILSYKIRKVYKDLSFS